MTRIDRGVGKYDERNRNVTFRAPGSAGETVKAMPHPDLVALRSAAKAAVSDILQAEFSDRAEDMPSHEASRHMFFDSGMDVGQLDQIDLYALIPVGLRIEIAEYLSYHHTPYEWKDFTNVISQMLLKKPAYLDYHDRGTSSEEPVSLNVFLKNYTKFTLQLPEYAAKVSTLLERIQAEFLPDSE